MGCGVSKDDISEPRPLQRKSSSPRLRPASSVTTTTTTTTHCRTPLTAIQDIEVISDGSHTVLSMNVTASSTTQKPPTPPSVIISQSMWKPSDSQIKTSLPSDLGALNLLPLKKLTSSSSMSSFSPELTPLLLASSQVTSDSDLIQCSLEPDHHPLNNEVGSNGLKSISFLKESMNNIINSVEERLEDTTTSSCKESGDLYHLGGPATEELILQISNAAAAAADNYPPEAQHDEQDVGDDDDVGDQLLTQESNSGCSLLDALANANSSISKQILMGGANFPVIVGGVRVLSGPIFTPARRAEIIDLEDEEEAEVQDASCGCQVDDHESTPESHCCSGNLQSCNILLTGDAIADQQQLLPSLDTRKKLPPLASLHHASSERGLNDPFVKPGLPITKSRVQQKDGSWRSVSPSQFFGEKQLSAHESASETDNVNNIKQSLLVPDEQAIDQMFHNNHSSSQETMMGKTACGWVSPSHNLLPDPAEIENISLESAQIMMSEVPLIPLAFHAAHEDYKQFS